MRLAGGVLGSALVAGGGLVECLGIGYLLSRGADAGVGPTVLWIALALAVLGTVGAVLAALGRTGRLSRVDPQAASLGAVACILANAVLLNAPPPTAGRFRLLFLAGGGVVAMSGVLSLAVALFEDSGAVGAGF